MTQKKAHVVLTLIIITFLIKGLFLAVLFPMYHGPDEPVHYNTIQHSAQVNITADTSYDDTEQFNEEIVMSMEELGFEHVMGSSRNTTIFSDTSDGLHEDTLRMTAWRRTSDSSHQWVVTHTPLYAMVGGWIEQALSHFSVIERFFALRFFGVFLGAGIIFLSYRTARLTGLSHIIALLTAAVLAFQPMFSYMSGVVNPDILFFFTFSLFLFASTLLLRYGLSWRRSIFLIIAIILTFTSKGTGIIVAPLGAMLLLYLSHTYARAHYSLSVKTYIFFAFASAALIVASLTFTDTTRNVFADMTYAKNFDSVEQSIIAYTQHTFTAQRLDFTHTSYWGNFGWLTFSIPEWSRTVLVFVELIATLGIAIVLLTRTPHAQWPQKRFVVFLLLSIITLQLSIRIYDWSAYKDGAAGVGTPGRYFLPNIIAHFILITTGLFGILRKEYYVRITLLLFLLILIATSMVSIFHRTLPYYYL